MQFCRECSNKFVRKIRNKYLADCCLHCWIDAEVIPAEKSAEHKARRL